MSSFLYKFSVLENIANRIVDIDNPIEKFDLPHKDTKKYYFQFRSSHKKLKSFVEDSSNPGTFKSTKNHLLSPRSIPWNQKILNTIDFVTNERANQKSINNVIMKRNDFIHANSTTGNKINISIEEISFLDEIIFKGLSNII